MLFLSISIEEENPFLFPWGRGRGWLDWAEFKTFLQSIDGVIWTYQEGETNYLCTSMHTSEGWMGYLYTYRRVPRKNGWLYYINMCMWKFYPHCWVCYFSLIIMNPLPGVGSSSYVINVAAPYSTHKCFAFIPACHSESVIRLIPLTLLLQPK